MQEDATKRTAKPGVGSVAGYVMTSDPAKYIIEIPVANGGVDNLRMYPVREIQTQQFQVPLKQILTR